MQFAPKLAYPCEQSVLPGDSRSNTGSFVGWSTGIVGPRYVLQTFSQAACHGPTQNLTLGTGEFVDGACKFMQGRSVQLTFNPSYANMSENQAAHAYLNSLCYQTGRADHASTSGHMSATVTPTSVAGGLVSTPSDTVEGDPMTSPFPISTGTAPDSPSPSTSVSNNTDPAISLLSSNQTSNLTTTSMTAETPTYTYYVPLTTSVAWNVHFTSAAPKPAIPLFITMMSSLAIVLLSGGIWDRGPARHHKIERKDE
ncbi:hypothetical protein MBLNU457_g0650t1 [Dothideomycetes sp. NU457]